MCMHHSILPQFQNPFIPFFQHSIILRRRRTQSARFTIAMKKTAYHFLFYSILSLLIFSCSAKSSEVQISSPLSPKYVAEGYKRIYISDFIISGKHVADTDININVNKEIKETLSSEFNDKSNYEIEYLDTEFDSARSPEEILRDASFWTQQDIEDKKESFIISGSVEFSNLPKSSLVTQEVTNPRTGQRRSVTASRQQTQLILEIDFYLIDAESGEKLFQEVFKEEEVYDDVSNVSLPLFYDIFDRIIPKIVGVIVPYRVVGSRILLEP